MTSSTAILERMVEQLGIMASLASDLEKWIRAIEQDGKKCRELDRRVRDLEQRAATVPTIRD